jgi:hypothetical protein
VRAAPERARSGRRRCPRCVPSRRPWSGPTH